MSGEDAAFVSQSDSEALLAAIAARTPKPHSWHLRSQLVLLAHQSRVCAFPGCGPRGAAATGAPVGDRGARRTLHGVGRPIARFHNTFRVVFTMVFGSLDQALAAARHLYALHTRIRGEMTGDVARWRRGSHYEANEIAALRWVFANSLKAQSWPMIARSPLTAAEREQYYAECKTLAGLFGIPTTALPENWEAFAAYNCAMHASDELGVTDAARDMAHNLLAGVGSWIRPPHWYRALTAEWMPERFRYEFNLDFSAAEQQSAASAKRRLPGIYRRLPSAIRFTGPWREAQARLAARRVSALTRWSNRFWIGRPLLPFG